MRLIPVVDTIGDSVSMALIQGGIVAGMGMVGVYSAINPSDIGPVEPPPIPRFNPYSGPDCTIITQGVEAKLPMTMHQRVYQWPKQGTGPVWTHNPSWASTPEDIPPIQMEWPVPVIQALPVTFEERPRIESTLSTETIIPQRGNAPRDYWTLYKTSPWAVMTQMASFAGDSKVFSVSGVTYNRSGETPVSGCRVLALCNVCLGFGSPAYVVAETVSDGSGAYSLNVTGRVVQVFAYKDDSPDLTGCSKKIIEGIADIYMSDPTEHEHTPFEIAAAMWSRVGRTTT